MGLFKEIKKFGKGVASLFSWIVQDEKKKAENQK